MKALLTSTLTLLVLVSFRNHAEAAVVGEKMLSLGADQKPMSWKTWLGSENALITPEAIHIATQACLRDTQKQQDARAYPVLLQLNEELALSLRQSTEKFGAGILALTDIVAELSNLAFARFPEPESYEPECRKVLEKHVTISRDKLNAIYAGRLNPKVPEEMKKRGLELTPMTWESLVQQACQLQGYYSLVSDPGLWKFYTASILYQSVLPAEEDDAEFVASILLGTLGTRAYDQLSRLTRYSAVAGRPNGPTLAVRGLWRSAAPRTTGPATGSISHSLLPTFTTAWRESLQATIMSRPYSPEIPFQLLQLEEILSAGSLKNDAPISAAEIGIHLVQETIKSIPADKALTDYQKTAALAWLAMNAETNVRQNEKLAGAVPSSIQRLTPTKNVLGAPENYAAIQKEIQAALTSYQALDEANFKIPRCLKTISDFINEAANLPKAQIGTTSDASRLALQSANIDPIALSLGLEVQDPQDGKFYLNLATGAGRAFPLKAADKTYLLWTPSAYLIHHKEELTTATWQEPQ